MSIVYYYSIISHEDQSSNPFKQFQASTPLRGKFLLELPTHTFLVVFCRSRPAHKCSSWRYPSG